MQKHLCSATQHCGTAMRPFHAPLFSLAHLLLRRVLEDERVELVAHVHIADSTAGLALEVDAVLLDLDLRLRVATGVALHKGFDETLQQLCELGHVVSAIDDGGACRLLKLGHRAQLAAVVLDDVCSSTKPSMSQTTCMKRGGSKSSTA